MKRGDQRARHPGDRGQRDHEQVEAVDAERVADAELGDPLVVGDVLEARRPESKSTSIATDVGEHARRVPASTAQRASPRGQERADQARGERQEEHDRQVDRHELADQEVEGQRRPRRPAAAARRRAGSRSGSRARSDVPTRTIPVAPPTIVPCTKSVSITRRPKRAERRAPAARTARRRARRSTTCCTRKRCSPREALDAARAVVPGRRR